MDTETTNATSPDPASGGGGIVTDVLWIYHSIDTNDHNDPDLERVVFHVVKQIARAISSGRFPYPLDESKGSQIYFGQYAKAATGRFRGDRRLLRMATQAASADIHHTPPSWVLDPFADWLRQMFDGISDDWRHISKMSFEEIDRRQKAWHASFHRDDPAETAKPAPLVYRYVDAWTWHHLVDRAHRISEGETMEHCVGSRSFDKLEPDSGIFSLRDPDGRSVVTVMLTGTIVAQAFGRRNARPTDDMIPRVDDLRTHLGENLRYGLAMWNEDGDWPHNLDRDLPTEDAYDQLARKLDF